MKPVSPDAAEQIKRLAQPVSAVVLPYDHVITATGCHKDDGVTSVIIDKKRYLSPNTPFRIVSPQKIEDEVISFSHPCHSQFFFF